MDPCQSLTDCAAIGQAPRGSLSPTLGLCSRCPRACYRSFEGEQEVRPPRVTQSLPPCQRVSSPPTCVSGTTARRELGCARVPDAPESCILAGRSLGAAGLHPHRL